MYYLYIDLQVVEGEERRSSRKRPVVDYSDDKSLDKIIKEQEEKEAKKVKSTGGGGSKSSFSTWWYIYILYSMVAQTLSLFESKIRFLLFYIHLMSVFWFSSFWLNTEASKVLAPKILPKRAAIPKKNADGELIFEDYPNFRPNLTPKEVSHTHLNIKNKKTKNRISKKEKRVIIFVQRCCCIMPSVCFLPVHVNDNDDSWAFWWFLFFSFFYTILGTPEGLLRWYVLPSYLFKCDQDPVWCQSVEGIPGGLV